LGAIGVAPDVGVLQLFVDFLEALALAIVVKDTP